MAMMSHPFRPAFAFALMCAGCNPTMARESSVPDVPSVPSVANDGAGPASSSSVAPPVVAGDSHDTKRSAGDGLNAFAFELYRQVNDHKKNVALSPFSISTALSMTATGARGETLAEMSRVLHVDPTPSGLARLGRLLSQYQAVGNKVTLRVANRLFAANGYTFDPSFLSGVGATFGAPAELMDFQHAPEPSRLRINEWVSEETREKIRDLLPAGSVTGETRLALVNAIYFLGDWSMPFAKESTRPAPFFTERGLEKRVPTMNQLGTFRFGAADGVKVLELPYVGGRLAMTLVLPDERDGLARVEARLSPAAYTRWVASLQHERVLVALPPFEMSEGLNLSPILSRMGMPDAFDRDKADFTGIANPPSPADRLFISAVFHKAFVKVDEKGTEAAAATAVLMMRAGAAMPQEPPKEWKGDHPFLFFLRDLDSGAILFMGRVADPA
jgi:serpin B